MVTYSALTLYSSSGKLSRLFISSDTPNLTPRNYRPRVVERLLHQALDLAPMVLLEGAKGCGKTWTGLNAAKSSLLLDANEDDLARTRSAPRQVLAEPPYPKLIDEYQRIPELWNIVKGTCDTSHDNRRFLLAGSVIPQPT